MIINMMTYRGAPPQQVNDAQGCYTNGVLHIVWNKPQVYDVDIMEYNVYLYQGDTKPTTFGEFTLITTTTNTYITHNIENFTNGYVLVCSKSETGVINKKLDYVATVGSSLVLNKMPWTRINDIASRGLAPTLLTVGDTKDIILEGKTHPVQIVGFNHDNLTSGGKAKITFSTMGAIDSKYHRGSDTNGFGWEESEIRTYLSSYINKLPQDLANIVKTVTKITYESSNRTQNTSDKLFLFSCKEVCNYSTYSDGGTQYKYFAKGEEYRKRYDTDLKNYGEWWTRTPYISGTTNYMYITTTGVYSSVKASTRYGVVFGFCI